MAASVASHIPLALSLLHTVATQYPGLTKSQPTTNVSTAPSAPQPSTFSTALPRSGGNGNGGSAVNGSVPNGAGQGGPLGTPPASSSGSALCEVIPNSLPTMSLKPTLKMILALSHEAQIHGRQ